MGARGDAGPQSEATPDYIRQLEKPSGPVACEIVPLMAAPGFLDAVSCVGREAGSARARIECPVLLLWGDRDPILPVSAARELESQLAQARLTVISGAGHSPMVEAPADLVAAILEFTGDDRRLHV